MKVVKVFSKGLYKTDAFTRVSLTVAVKLQKHNVTGVNIAGLKSVLSREWFYKVFITTDRFFFLFSIWNTINNDFLLFYSCT